MGRIRSTNQNFKEAYNEMSYIKKQNQISPAHWMKFLALLYWSNQNFEMMNSNILLSL